tara:strand:- start:42 stop:692 length:651 start_codon:yes stop_codon:yes gene_type:complete
MAANEHKNLISANRHNPKGFENAENDTILTKGLGTEGNKDGNLEWINKSSVKVKQVTLSGYCTLATNYKYSETQAQGQSPYDINQDYGSATISSSTTVSQKKFFRIGNVCNGIAAGNINIANLQVSSSNAESFTVALVSYTPSSTLTTAYPVVLIEKSVVGLSSDNLVNSYNLASTDFASRTIGLGTHLFLMVKAGEETTSPVVYVNMTVDIGYLK